MYGDNGQPDRRTNRWTDGQTDMEMDIDGVIDREKRNRI